MTMDNATDARSVTPLSTLLGDRLSQYVSTLQVLGYDDVDELTAFANDSKEIGKLKALLKDKHVPPGHISSIVRRIRKHAAASAAEAGMRGRGGSRGLSTQLECVDLHAACFFCE